MPDWKKNDRERNKQAENEQVEEETKKKGVNDEPSSHY